MSAMTFEPWPPKYLLTGMVLSPSSICDLVHPRAMVTDARVIAEVESVLSHRLVHVTPARHIFAEPNIEPRLEAFRRQHVAPTLQRAETNAVLANVSRSVATIAGHCIGPFVGCPDFATPPPLTDHDARFQPQHSSPSTGPSRNTNAVV
jgi:hypothetical protein